MFDYAPFGDGSMPIPHQSCILGAILASYHKHIRTNPDKRIDMLTLAKEKNVSIALGFCGRDFPTRSIRRTGSYNASTNQQSPTTHFNGYIKYRYSYFAKIYIVLSADQDVMEAVDKYGIRIGGTDTIQTEYQVQDIECAEKLSIPGSMWINAEVDYNDLECVVNLNKDYKTNNPITLEYECSRDGYDVESCLVTSIRPMNANFEVALQGLFVGCNISSRIEGLICYRNLFNSCAEQANKEIVELNKRA